MQEVVPQYQPQDVTAQAPRVQISPFLLARSGQQVGEGLQRLGGALDELGVPLAEEKGAQDAQAAVTRAPDGTPQVETPQTSFLFGRTGDAYGAAVQAGETARLHTMMQSDFADMASRYQGDPDGFKQNAASYVQNLAGAQSSPIMQQQISGLGNELAVQHYAGLVDQKANADIKSAYDGIGSQIEAQKNEIFALARQGGTGTPEFQQSAQKLGALYDSLESNPLFAKLGISKDTIDYERSNVNAQATAEATIGSVDRTFTRQGRAAAQTQLEDGVLNNPSLNLSDAQRNSLYHTGLARLEYLTGENKAQIDASRVGVNMAVEQLAKGVAVPDSVLDQIQNQSKALGDFESVERLEAQRMASRAAQPFAGLNSGQRVAGVMGGNDYLTDLHATENPSGNPFAGPGTSSALGPNQFTAETWARLASAHPELGLTPNGRTDAAQNARAIVAFTADNRAYLQSRGIAPTDKNTYMAHFLGAQGGAQFIEAMDRDPAQTAASLFPQAAAANHAVFYNRDGSARSLSDTYNFATRKFGSGTTALGAPSANGNPFTPDQYAANPFLASAYLRQIASDSGAQVRYGKNLGASIEQGLKNGFMPSPQTLGAFLQVAGQNPDKLGDQADRVKGYLLGANAGQEAERAGVAGHALLDQAEQAAQGGSIMQQQLAEGMRDWMQHSDANLKAHPFGEAVNRGWIAKAPDPLNFQDQNALAQAIHQRGIAATIIGSRTGEGAMPAFSPTEEAQVKALVSNPGTPADTRLHLLGALTQNLPAPVLRATMAKIAGDKGAAPFAVAGDLSTKNPDAALGLLQGQAAAAAEPRLVPKSTDWAPALASKMPLNAFPDTPQRQALDASIRAYYGKLSADANDVSQTLDDSRMDQAVQAVTGGILSSGSSKVFAPWYGATQDQLDAAVKGLKDADFANARTSNGSAFHAASLQGLRPSWRLMSAGDGKYRVVSGPPDRPNPLIDVVAHRPFILDLSNARGAAPAPPVSSMELSGQPPSAPLDYAGRMNAFMLGR